MRFLAAGESALVVELGNAIDAELNGRVYASWDLAAQYGIDDADGTRPHFVRWLREHMPEVARGWRKLDDAFYAYWGKMPYAAPT